VVPVVVRVVDFVVSVVARVVVVVVDVVVVDLALSAASIVEETSSWTVDEMGSKVPTSTALEVVETKGTRLIKSVVVDGCAEVA